MKLGNQSQTMTSFSRRSFLAGTGAVLAAPALGAPAASGETETIIVGAGAAGIAAARRLAAAGRRYRAGRGRRSRRRALHHRHQDLRRAVRSRRALDLFVRHQSGDQGAAQRESRNLSGAAGPAGADRPSQCTRKRAGGFSLERGARQSRDRRRRARQGRRELRAGAAEGSRRVEIDRRFRARSLQLRRRSQRDFVDGLGESGRSRQQRVLPARIRRAAGEPSRQHSGAAVDAGDADRHPGQQRRRRSPHREGYAARPLRDRHGFDRRAVGWQDRLSRRSCPSGSSTRSPDSRWAASITLRWSSAAIRSACSATMWCSRSRPIRRPAPLLANIGGTSLATVSVAGKFGRELSAKGEQGNGRFRDRLADRPLRRRHPQGGEAHRMRRTGILRRSCWARSRRQGRAAR